MYQDRLTRLEVLRVAGRVSGYDFDDLQQEARTAVWQKGVEQPAHVRRVARSVLQRLRLASMTASRHPTDRVGRLVPLVYAAPGLDGLCPYEARERLEARLTLDALRQAHPTQFACLVSLWEQNGSLTADDPQCKSALATARQFLADGGCNE